MILSLIVWIVAVIVFTLVMLPLALAETIIWLFVLLLFFALSTIVMGTIELIVWPFRMILKKKKGENK